MNRLLTKAMLLGVLSGCGLATMAQTPIAQPSPSAPAATAAQQKPTAGKMTPTTTPESGNGSKDGGTGKIDVPLSEQAQMILNHNTWAYPMFKTGEPQAKEITEIEHFPYVEQLYKPAYTIEAQAKSESSLRSPEQAMNARTSSMMRADYPGWLQVWDPASRTMTEELEAEHNITPQQEVELWNGAFRKVRFTLTRRIQTGPYVIVTYQLTADGKPVYAAEFPVIFHQLDGEWYATQDLSRDPLPSLMPWTNGETRKELDVRPIEIEKNANAEIQVIRPQKKEVVR